MLALIRKEIINVYSWVLIIYLVSLGSMINFVKSDPVHLILTITFLIAYKNFENENKVNMDVIINSLPVSRLNVIVAKYISFYLYFLIAFMLCFLMSEITAYLFSSVRSIDFNEKLFLTVACVWGIYMAAYIPPSVLVKTLAFQYLFGFIMVITLPFILKMIIGKEFSPFKILMELDLLYLLLAVILSLILNVISCSILYSIYRKKDLL